VLGGLHFLALGPLGPEQLQVRWQDVPRPTSDEIESVIEQAWRQQLARAQAQGVELYDGRMARYIRHEQPGRRLIIYAGPTTYREFVGTNLFGAHHLEAWGWERFANPIGTSAVLVTSDGWLLLGRRGQRVVFHAGCLHAFGGALEEADLVGTSRIDAFGAMLRELTEELGLAREELTRLSCTGLLHDSRIWQPELVFDAELTLSRDEVEARLAEQDRDSAEHSHAEGCRDEPEGLREWLDSARPVTPVAVGAVLLHGRRVWGSEWFARQLKPR
jgi:8-oxo-dGTP pyrophosphatase MutT (NUDIX family)